MNDDTLILYYYNDGLSTRERQEVANAIATDAKVAGRYEAICRELGSFRDPVTPRPPSDMVQRWHASLDRAAGIEQQRNRKPVVHSWSFLLGAAVTAALAVGIGIGIGFMLNGEPMTPDPVAGDVVASNAAQGTGGSTAFVRGLQVHLRESERGLAAMPADSARAGLIADMIEQNRLYAIAADQNDSADMARVLRAFDLVLLQLASEDIDQAEAEALRTKLIFELNVVLTKLSRSSSDEQQSI
jgi:hypothetical protein